MIRGPKAAPVHEFAGDYYVDFATSTAGGLRRNLLRARISGRALGFVDGFAQGRAAGDAVGEPRGELLHLAHGVGQFFFDQHLEIGADHLVAVDFGGLVVERARQRRTPFVPGRLTAG